MMDDPPRALVQECRLFSGVQSYFVQFVLAVVALSTLWYKRTVERPKRSFEIWSLDVGKQGLGAIVGHVANLVIALCLPTAISNECIWYFVNFCLDATLGTMIAIVLFQYHQELAQHYRWSRVQHSGEYGDPVSYLTWTYQVMTWLSIVLISKALVTASLLLTPEMLGHVGNWLFYPLQNNPFLELVVVMVLCPCFLNVMQFWIQDSFLKQSQRNNILTRHKAGASSDPSLRMTLLTSAFGDSDSAA